MGKTFKDRDYSKFSSKASKNKKQKGKRRFSEKDTSNKEIDLISFLEEEDEIKNG